LYVIADDKYVLLLATQLGSGTQYQTEAKQLALLTDYVPCMSLLMTSMCCYLQHSFAQQHVTRLKPNSCLF